ncbi:MAG: competence/damage-inducible protein A [Verrucomicrobiia bacterium]
MVGGEGESEGVQAVRVELINTGSELLLGLVQNTHLGFVSDCLGELGLRVARQATIPDGPLIGEAVGEAWRRSDLVLVTGGLGPTSDDVTREEVAGLLGRQLVFHEEILEKIQGYFARRGLRAPESVRAQAFVPEGAEVLPNRHGTAPGFWVEQEGKKLACLPGPPREFCPMMVEEVLPRLRRWLPGATGGHRKILRIMGIGESAVQERMEGRLRAECPGLEIGYCARSGEVDLRLFGMDEGVVARGADLVRREFGEAIYGEDREGMEEVVVRRATALGRTMATAESCTGGMIAHRLTDVPGASAVFLRGWVTYSNEAKMEELGVAEELLREQGAVSEAVARAMARGALERSGADLAVATTGIAGPSGGTESKPVGLIFLGLARREAGGEVVTEVMERHLVQQRAWFKQQASQVALDWLRRSLGLGR